MPASSTIADRPLPRCLACGKSFAAAAREARRKLTCSRRCRSVLAAVSGAKTQAAARRLLCESYPGVPAGHLLRNLDALLAYRLAVAARQRLTAVIQLAGRPGVPVRPRRPRPAPAR